MGKPTRPLWWTLTSRPNKKQGSLVLTSREVAGRTRFDCELGAKKDKSLLVLLQRKDRTPRAWSLLVEPTASQRAVPLSPCRPGATPHPDKCSLGHRPCHQSKYFLDDQYFVNRTCIYNKMKILRTLSQLLRDLADFDQMCFE